MKLLHGDCIELMKDLPSKSIDLILTDLPYGMLNCAWDKIINYDELWKEYKRLAKPGGVILLFGAGGFSFDLVNTNREMFKYKLVWIKRGSTNFANAKYRPMTKHEDILVFSDGGCSNNAKVKMVYNPQGLVKIDKRVKSKKGKSSIFSNSKDTEYIQEFTNYPNDVLLGFNEVISFKKLHPL